MSTETRKGRSQAPTFDKYQINGGYHWRECDRRSRDFNPALVARYAMILSRVGGGRALDVGAGDGYLTARLAERCSHVVGIEYEETGVAVARTMLAKFRNAEVRPGSAYELPFPANSFDVVTMADVIEHLEDPEKAVAEMARVASPDSVTYVTTPQWRLDRVWDSRHVKEYRAEEFVALMRTGFRRVDMVYAWPRAISDLYRTRVGWRLLRFAGRCGVNPFVREGTTPAGFCQMMAVCRDPG